MTKDANRLSMSFKRNDVILLLDALEAIIEDLKYDGGTILAEPYMGLRARIENRLRSHDRTPFRTTLVKASGE